LEWRLSFPSLYRWFGIYCERTLDPLADGWVFDIAVRLLHLSIHHQSAAKFSYKSMAATALAVVLGIPRVEECTLQKIDLTQLDWMMMFLNSPSVILVSEASRYSKVEKLRVSGRSIEKMSSSDLEFILSRIIV
jgi:hypothetical protein